MSTTIRLDAGLTLRNVEALREKLLDGFAEHGAVTLDAAALAEADLSALQLIEAARAHAAREGKRIALAQPVNAILAALLERAGFLAEPSADDLDFWFHGDLPQ